MPAADILIKSDQMSPPSPTPPNFGTYMNDGERKIDYVLVYKDDGQQKDGAENEERRKFFEENLESVGLHLETDRIEQKGELLSFVKVHAPWKVLCQQAEQLHMKMPLKLFDKPVVKQNTLVKNPKDPVQGLVDFSFRPQETMQTLDGLVIHWPFKRKRQDLYAIRDENTFFSEKQRIEIVYEMLQKADNNPHKNKERGLEALLEENIYIAGYPIHDGDLLKRSDNDSGIKTCRQNLKNKWANWRTVFHRQPLNDVRNYFGEKIGFYYAFMDEYTRMLTFPSLIGLVTFLFGVISTSFNPEMTEICTRNEATSEAEIGGHTESVHHEFVKNVTSATAISEFYVGDYKMCPICRPPDCEHWEMWNEGCFQYGWSYRLDNQCSFILSSFTTLWAIIFLKFWKRREATLAAEWGTEDSEEQDINIRPEYEKRAPAHRKNPITLEQEPYIPLKTKWKWMSVSILATVLFLLFACGCLICLVISRIKLYAVMRHLPHPFKEKSIDIARWLIHGLIFIVVVILENAYNHIAFKLTAYECPKTEKKFLNSLLWKVFIFQLLNDLIPIGYAAWMKGKTVKTPLSMKFMDELCDGGCMGEVTELVAILLLLRLVIGNATEIGIPLMKNAMKRFRMRKEVVDNTAIPQFLKDYQLEKVEFDGVYEDYMEMMIQFAFIVLFIPALPVAPFVCLLNNIAEIRVDGTKMLQTNRRALPIRVSGIGIWNRFLNIINKLGIIVNAGLLAFTSDNIPRMYYTVMVKPGVGYHGFTKWSLTSINVSLYGNDAHEMIESNITECWYPDFRERVYPYNEYKWYWEITFYRMVVFAVYCVVFFTLTWVVNTFVSDMPESVKTKVQRRHHLVAKALEVDAAIKQTKWTNDNVVPGNNEKSLIKNGKVPSMDQSFELNDSKKWSKEASRAMKLPLVVSTTNYPIESQEMRSFKDNNRSGKTDAFSTILAKADVPNVPQSALDCNSVPPNVTEKLEGGNVNNGSISRLNSINEDQVEKTQNKQPNPRNFLFKIRQDSQQSEKLEQLKNRRKSSAFGGSEETDNTTFTN